MRTIKIAERQSAATWESPSVMFFTSWDSDVPLGTLCLCCLITICSCLYMKTYPRILKVILSAENLTWRCSVKRMPGGQSVMVYFQALLIWVCCHSLPAVTSEFDVSACSKERSCPRTKWRNVHFFHWGSSYALWGHTVHAIHDSQPFSDQLFG